jgi:hypothetical protein
LEIGSDPGTSQQILDSYVPNVDRGRAVLHDIARRGKDAKPNVDVEATVNHLAGSDGVVSHDHHLVGFVLSNQIGDLT